MLNLWHKLPQTKQLQSQVENICIQFKTKQAKAQWQNWKETWEVLVIKEIFWVAFYTSSWSWFSFLHISTCIMSPALWLLPLKSTDVQIHQVHICVLNIVGYHKMDKTPMFKHPPKSLILQLNTSTTSTFNMLLVLRDISRFTSLYR